LKQFVRKPEPEASVGTPGSKGAVRHAWRFSLLAVDAEAWRAIVPPGLAVVLAFAVAAVPIAFSGKNPLLAYWALVRGAVGSINALAFAVNKSTPYILAGVGVAVCFRSKVINIGSEGQIAVGGIAASWIALNFPRVYPPVLIVAALIAAAIIGAAWAGIAAVIRLKRGVHEVLGTLMLNFVGTLLVSEVLRGPMGEVGAGFPQSPLFAQEAWLPQIFGTNMHLGIIVAVLAILVCHVLLWHTPFGFRLRLLGSSRTAAAYAGVSFGRTVLEVMLIASRKSPARKA
jgi:general nucleoside transport system permease protein